MGCFRCSEGLVGGDRPDEAGELAGAGDDDLLLRFAAAGHPLPALVEALLAAPGALEHERRLVRVGGARARSRPAAAGVRARPTRRAAGARGVADLGDRALPAPLAGGCSDGTSPTKAMNSSALAKRLKSPISATSPSAVRVSTPRKQRSRATSCAQRPLLGESRGSPARAARSGRRRGRRRAGRRRR